MSKNIVRVNKTNNYTVMSNYHLKDDRLSWKAKGIHSYILSLPDDWKVVIEHLRTVSRDGRDSTRSGIQELYDLRYWQKYPVYENGLIKEWVTEIYEEPFPENKKIKSIVFKNGIRSINYENGVVDNSAVDNLTLLTDIPQVVDNTKSELLTGNLQVDKLEVDNPELLNTNNTNITNVTNHSINPKKKKKDRLTDKNILLLLSKKYESDIITIAIQKANKAKEAGTVINNLYSYLDAICKETKSEKEILNKSNSYRKTDFHMNEQRSDNYTADELEDIMKRKRKEYIEKMKDSNIELPFEI